ncbi:hypothetical protein ACF07T_40680 [Streptomyces sp. NPDC015184]|uniref:hypothetical protein n=1 Tax=Streptomyces sp. NPDC015184 TaxID=3364946 RepID=UPI0036FCDD24
MTRSSSRRKPPGPWPTTSALRSKNCTAGYGKQRLTSNASRSPGRPSPPSPTGSRPSRRTCPSTRPPRILAVFNEASGPLRARDVCEALDHELLPKNIEGTRAKLKRLFKLDIITEIDTGSFARKQ